jgi:hypothetical protein
MRHRLRSHLTYANVVVTILAFVVLGGGTALASFVVSSNSQVAPGTISGHHPPSGDHANIIAGSINGQDVAPNRLGGGQINESTLGRVPNADALDGIDSNGFVQGSGRILTIDTSADANGSATLFNLPGFVEVDGLCGDTANAGNAGIRTYGQPVDVLSDNGGANATLLHLSANSSNGSSFWSQDPAGDSLTLSLQASGGNVATAFIFEYTFHSPFLHEDICKYQGHVIVAGA